MLPSTLDEQTSFFILKCFNKFDRHPHRVEYLRALARQKPRKGRKGAGWGRGRWRTKELNPEQTRCTAVPAFAAAAAQLEEAFQRRQAKHRTDKTMRHCQIATKKQKQKIPDWVIHIVSFPFNTDSQRWLKFKFAGLRSLYLIHITANLYVRSRRTIHNKPGNKLLFF